jgi:hypothetical protein
MMVALALSVAACGQKPKAEDSATDPAVPGSELAATAQELTAKQEVKARAAAFFAAYEQRNVNGVLSYFTSLPVPAIFGTNAGERRVGLAEIRTQLELDFAAITSASFAWSFVRAEVYGGAGWTMHEGTVTLVVQGQTLSLPIRSTGTFLYKGGAWRIVQMHWAIPATP